MVLEQEGYTVEILPLEGDYSKSVVKENAILYNDVYEHIDIQYTVQGKNIKEDIILRERTDKNTFSYAIRSEGLTAALEEQAVVLSDAEGKDVFVLMAPFMSDAGGEVSLGVSLALEEKENESILTVTADKEWLNAEERVYPVKIDPSSVSVEASSNWGLFTVAEGKPNATIGYGLSYVGYDDGKLSNTLASGEGPYGNCKTYVRIGKDFTLMDEFVTVENAVLRITQASRMGSENETIEVSRVKSSWSPDTITWNIQENFYKDILSYGHTKSAAGLDCGEKVRVGVL